jgi:carbon monoxide dehydrogenase subunit G
MQIEKTFTVRAPTGAVWDFLTDPRRVAGCLPGAAITEQVDETTYGGTITVKVGPVTASYKGTMRFERLDREAGEAELSASGQETRGKGGADMRMKSRVVERGPEETEVVVTSDVNVVGVLAQFGRGMIQDVSDQLFGRFTDCMRRQLEGPGEPAAAAAGGTAGGEIAPATPAAAESAPASGEAKAEAPALGREAAEAAARAAVPEATASAPARPPAEPALDVLELGRAAAGRAAARTLGRPGFWIALAALALLVYWFLLR